MTSAEISAGAVPKPGRDAGVDCARGLAMVLVVLGHNTAFAALSPTAIAFVFAFHVPAFFFLSGYLLRPDRANFAKFANRILLPFFAFGGALALTKAMVRGTGVGVALLGLLWGTGATLPSSQLWFLPTLFCTLVLSALLARRWGKGGLVPAMTISGLCVLGYFALELPPPPLNALRTSTAGPVGWFWNIDLLPLASFYCLCGFWFSRAARLNALPPWSALVAMLGVGLCFSLGARADMNLRLSQPYPLALVAGLCGSFAVLKIGQALASLGGWGKASLAYVGQYTLSILLWHVPVQNAVVTLVDRADDPAWPWVGTITGTCAGVVIPVCLAWFGTTAMTATRSYVGVRRCNPRY